MREIKVALVGCGFVANDHLRAWKKVREARVVAVSDLNENAVTKTAELWKIPHYYKSFSELIEQNEIDLVDICTPPQTHASLAVQAMKAGFHILLEKPMALDLKDAKKIAQCQKATGQKGGVIHNWLFEPTVLNATSLIEKGRLGEVISLEVEVLHTKYDHMVANEHHWCHGSQGGRFSEMLAHPIYLTRHFLGEVKIGDVRVSKIGGYAWMKSDELCATFKSGEKLGRIYISFNAPRDEIFIGLHGREAILQLNMINATTSLLPKREVSRFSIKSIRMVASGAMTLSTEEWLISRSCQRGMFSSAARL